MVLTVAVVKSTLARDVAKHLKLGGGGGGGMSEDFTFNVKHLSEV
jgi:hypothetical protein